MEIGAVGYEFPEDYMEVTEEMIKQYAEASYDFNPLHLDTQWMSEASFGGTKFRGVIGHGLMTYSLITRMVTKVIYPAGGWHERCEVRFKAPVHPGDRITASGKVIESKDLEGSTVYVASVQVVNQNGQIVAQGDAMGRIYR